MTVRRKGRTGLGSGCLFLSRAAVDRATVRPSDCLTFSSRESGETGRRTRLRIWRRKAWGFESPLSHVVEIRVVTRTPDQSCGRAFFPLLHEVFQDTREIPISTLSRCSIFGVKRA